MNIRFTLTATAALLLSSGIAAAQQTHAGHGTVGAVTFANSCAPAVQDDLMRGVAMLHSFWYGEGETTFRAVLARDPSCAIANWGIASLLMSNPLACVGSKPPDAVKAQAAIALGRSIGAETRRERDYIEAVATYYQDFVTRPETAPQASRATADEALAGACRRCLTSSWVAIISSIRPSWSGIGRIPVNHEGAP